MKSIKRGELYWIYLGETKGSEQKGRRPVLVLQNNHGNELAPTTIIAPLTTKSFSREFPTNVNLPRNTSGLKSDSTILLSQIRTVDKVRLKKKIGDVTGHYMEKVDFSIKVSLGLI